jgi:hypothetical protein
VAPGTSWALSLTSPLGRLDATAGRRGQAGPRSAPPLVKLARRPTRTLPIDRGPASASSADIGQPLVESVWIEPYPEDALGVVDGYAAPEARYEQREAVELAFIAALQHLPTRQRAVLIMRDVLGLRRTRFLGPRGVGVAGNERRLGEQRVAACPQGRRRATSRAESAANWLLLTVNDGALMPFVELVGEGHAPVAAVRLASAKHNARPRPIGRGGSSG